MTPDPEKRRLPSWIASFIQYTNDHASPLLFRRWAAVATLAGALERRTWARTNQGIIWPNFFILLVGPPGVGKDQAIMAAKDLWTATGAFKVAPQALTHKGLFDQLASEQHVKSYTDSKGRWHRYHTMLVAIPEFGVLMPAHELGYLAMLNELFHCYSVFEERTRGGGTLKIENPHIHLLGGTQPKYLQSLLPEEAFGMGFTARVIFVYDGKPVKQSLFTAVEEQDELKEDLVHDLRLIAQINGQFSFTAEAAQKLEHWHMELSQDDGPDHSKLIHYNTRRILHVIKLCMAFSISRTDDLIINEEDLRQSLELLFQTESVMPEVFKEMASGGQMDHLEESFYFLRRAYLTDKKPISEQRLISFLALRVPVREIDQIIATMIRGKMVKVIDMDPALPEGYKRRAFEPMQLTKVE